MYVNHALDLELARAHRANHLAAADDRLGGRQAVMARRDTRRASRRRRRRTTLRPVWLTGHPAA
ncbi:MAG TPA: hypothetical protein VER39_08960 [Nocardioidaceae bacterium]|nr:hypothetical protein [Nocardioidaceae bacterium]